MGSAESPHFLVRLVDRLRGRGAVILSLVAERNGEVAGHAFFTPVTIESETGETFDAVGLGPVAAAAGNRNVGIGSALISSGIEELARAGHSVLVVLGHPGYYSRFGFVPASRFGIACAWDVPDEAFMALMLNNRISTPGGSFKAKYQPEFNLV